MARTARLAVFVLASTIGSFTFGTIWAHRAPEQERAKEKVTIAGIDYEARGNLTPAAGQNFPKSWGRLIGYAAGADKGLFLFEAEDGVLRQVTVTFSHWVWKEPARIEGIHVLAIGRR